MKSSKSRKGLNSNVKVRVAADYPWQILDRMVDDLSDSLGEANTKEIKAVIRKRSFAEYLELAEAWGPQSSTPGDMSKELFFAKYQIVALLKKFQFPSDKLARRTAALEKFRLAEEACAQFNREGCKTLAFLTDPEELQVFTYAQRFLSRLLGEVLPEQNQLTLWSRHGPGSNLDTMERNVSLYDKYKGWPYSCTGGALRYARSAIKEDERWLGALEDDYRRKNGIEPWRILDQQRFWTDVFNVVPGNRITFVPKNSLTDRSIAIEPCMNLYLQLGVDGYIRRRLKRWGIDLDDQSKNQILAGRGSKYWRVEDPFVTLDLAAASDTISLGVCRLLLPPQWYAYLNDLRSPTGELEGEEIKYHKISSMGNGFTFALESAIFAAIVYGVERTLKGSFNRDEVAIYGDDIIVRKSSAPLTIQMLNRCGFSLNLEKSFLEGPFRESCGADWFDGTAVRPVFLTSAPSTVMELFNDYNRLRRVLSLRRWGFEFEVASKIREWIPEAFHNVTGPLSDEDFDSYMHTPFPTVRYRGCMWKFRRLVVTPKHRRGPDFLFRKLMHSLRSPALRITPSELSFKQHRMTWGGAKLTAAGSVFTITKPSSVVVGYSSSRTSIWCDEYTDMEVIGGP